ncbi:MAG: flagellar biosynthesis protein FlhB [Rubrivivax sp.]|nr:flagellar biosynthesis protein FlhB [Rubrivivax sp.]
MADSQDKQLPASARKLSKAREDGQVARSRDLGHAAAMAMGAALLVGLAPEIVARLRELLASGLRFDAGLLAANDAMLRQLIGLTLQMLAMVLPLGAAMILAALAAGKLCGGWNWTLKPLQPKLSKLNPLEGIGRIFSKVQLVETLKACLLATVLLAIGGGYLWSNLDAFSQVVLQPLPTALASSGDLLRGGLVLMLLALGAFALVDVPLQKWRLGEQLKMSHQEVKDEFKQIEGNVEVKAKIKARMRQLARRRMLAAVPEADLVVMNPTHYAVALRYDEATMAAPRVVAKGTDLLALKIRDIATEHRVPVLQAPPLARALYAHTELDQDVPTVLFGAVAQVLAWVYQLRHAATPAAAALPAPQPVVPPELDPHNGPVPRARPRGDR